MKLDRPVEGTHRAAEEPSHLHHFHWHHMRLVARLHFHRAWNSEKPYMQLTACRVPCTYMGNEPDG